MALIKLRQLSTGETVEYWRIVRREIQRDNSTFIYLEGFKNKQSALDGLQPTASELIILYEKDYPTNIDDNAKREKIYPAIKNIYKNGIVENGEFKQIDSWFKDAVDD